MKTLIMVALCTLATSCAWFKTEAKQTGAKAVDCTAANARSLVREFGPAVEGLLVQVTDDAGAIDWNPLKTATAGFAVGTGLCVLADVVARALDPRSSKPGAPQSSPLQVDREALRAGWRRLVDERAPGVTFKTDGGTL